MDLERQLEAASKNMTYFEPSKLTEKDALDIASKVQMEEPFPCELLERNEVGSIETMINF